MATLEQIRRDITTASTKLVEIDEKALAVSSRRDEAQVELEQVYEEAGRAPTNLRLRNRLSHSQHESKSSPTV